MLRKLVLAGLGFQMRFAIFGYFDDEHVRKIDVPTRVVLCSRDSQRAVDLHHGLLLIEPEFLREQVTATEQYTA